MSTVALIKALKATHTPYKLAKSPVTGQMAVYTQVVGASIVQSGSGVNTTALVTAINDGLTQQNFDFLPSDTKVGFLITALSETYYPEVWANTAVTAEGQLQMTKKDGTFVAPAIILGALIALLVTSIGAVMYWNIYKAENTLAYRDPNDGTIKTILGKTPFLSTMNALYYYTCPKDGVGVGLRSKYATLTDYQNSPEYSAEMAYLKDHCDNARDLLGNLGDMVNTIVIAIVAVAGVYFVSKIIPLFGGK